MLREPRFDRPYSGPALLQMYLIVQHLRNGQVGRGIEVDRKVQRRRRRSAGQRLISVHRQRPTPDHAAGRDDGRRGLGSAVGTARIAAGAAGPAELRTALCP